MVRARDRIILNILDEVRESCRGTKGRKVGENRGEVGTICKVK